MGYFRQELASGTGSCHILLAKDGKTIFPSSELDPVAALELLTLNRVPIDTGSVAALAIKKDERAVVLDDGGMFTGDARVGENETIVGLTSDGEIGSVEYDLALLHAIDHNQHGFLKARSGN